MVVWPSVPSAPESPIMSLMFPQLTSFFSDLKYGLTSSRRGSHRTAASSATTSSMDELDDHDESRPAPAYNCLGSRSASMECGLSAVGRKRRRRRFKKQPLCSAESLDRLSDRVYRYLYCIHASQRSCPWSQVPRHRFFFSRGRS